MESPGPLAGADAGQELFEEGCGGGGLKNLWLIAAACLAFGCVFGAMWDAATLPRLPQEVKITRSPDEARIKALEARIDLLEAWAVRQGGKFK